MKKQVIAAILSFTVLLTACGGPRESQPPAVSSSQPPVESSSTPEPPPEPEIEIMERVTQITGFDYTYGEHFCNGYAFAIRDGSCGYLDAQGNFKELYGEKEANLDSFFPNRRGGEEYLIADRLGIVPYCQGGKWGYYDLKNDRVLVQPQFDIPTPFGFPVKTTEDLGGSMRTSYRFFDPEGNEVDRFPVPEGGYLSFGTIENPKMGLFLIANSAGEKAIMNTEGQVIIPGEYLADVGVKGGSGDSYFVGAYKTAGADLASRISHYDPITVEKGNGYAVFSCDGQLLFETADYGFLGAFHHGRGYYQYPGSPLFGVIDYHGNQITEPIFTNVWPFNENSAWVSSAQGAYQLIGKDGKVLTETTYGKFEVRRLLDRVYSGVSRDDVYVILDNDGEEYYPEKYHSSDWLMPWWMESGNRGGWESFAYLANRQYTHLNTVLFLRDGKYGVMELNEETDQQHVILPAEYDAYYKISDNGMLMLRKEDKFAFFRENALYDSILANGGETNCIPGDMQEE